MSSSQLSTDQPIASSSKSGGSKPRLIIKIPQTLQSALLVPFSNTLPSAPPAAKKMQPVAFKCSMCLNYPSISITDCIPSSLPTGLQPIYEDAYLANSSPEVLDRVAADEWKSIFGHYPSCEYCALHNLHSTCSLCPNSLLCATCEVNYPSKELGLALGGPRALEGKRKAGESDESVERELLGELSCEQVIPALSRKGKEVICDPIDIDVKMEAPDTMESMELDYPEEVPSTSALVPAAPAPAPMKPAVVWKVNNRRSYCEVSSLKTWFFEPLVKPVPSDSTIPSQDDMIRAAIECIVMQVTELLSGCSKVMMEQDLWALADGLVQGIFNDLEEQMKHPSSDPPAPFSNSRLTQFVESLSMINLSSANIKLDCLETENLHLKEQVSLRDGQLEEKDEELTCLKSFMRHFKGDVPSTEVRQLREALEGQESEIESLKAKLAASEEARRVAVEESKSQDEEFAQLWQLFESVRGQFAAALPAKHSSGSS
ncbi:hypothetical protein GYMLUDRAFT_245677 [Collybiopsis luxurians FD-317 M1]|uniref:Uncharacterized protein n=1 Tax=Collybiopsis luxurians FD-317 M1 TaxID=944289 RepID=A0A0D0CT46_9AGAR|nr:hypothetical protein GYMLUDRAFT_245677 [Collybiopsis luxurians FD-317 M1]